MKFQIGAMSVGDILDRGLKLLLARLWTFYAINLIVLSPVLLLLLALPFVVERMSDPTTGILVAGIGGGLFIGLLALILAPIGTAAILHVISMEFIDARVGLGEAFSFALRRFGSILGVSILAGLAIGAGAVACLVPGILFAVWFVFGPQVVVVENRGPTDALSRSKDLTEGYRWRVLGLLGLFFLINMGVQMAVGILGVVLPSVEQVPIDRGDNPFSLGFRQVYIYRNYVINTVVSQLANILVQTFQAVCMTLLYFDLRIRKEGFDLELAARQQQAPTLR